MLLRFLCSYCTVRLSLSSAWALKAKCEPRPQWNGTFSLISLLFPVILSDKVGWFQSIRSNMSFEMSCELQPVNKCFNMQTVGVYLLLLLFLAFFYCFKFLNHKFAFFYSWGKVFLADKKFKNCGLNAENQLQWYVFNLHQFDLKPDWII